MSPADQLTGRAERASGRASIRAAGAPADTELERVRTALARGTDLATALDTQARPARGADGLAALG